MNIARPEAGKAVSGIIVAGVKTPVLTVKFSNLVNPFYYPNSLSIPRYSLTLIVNPDIHEDFVKEILDIQKREGVSTGTLKEEMIKNHETGNVFTSGNWIIKVQGKAIPEIKKVVENGLEDITLKNELPPGTQASVVFDLIRYTNFKNSDRGITMRPTLILLHGDAEIM